MKRMLIAALCLCIVGCTNNAAPTETVDINMNADLSSTCAVYLENPYENNEFKGGFYITPTSAYQTIPEFESHSVAHSIYGFEMNINDSFPISDVLQCYIYDKLPLITIYCDQNNLPSYSQVLNLAMDFGSIDVPVCINLMPFSSSNWTDMDKYTALWEEIAKTFKREAPNVTVVWSIFGDDAPLCNAVMPNTELFAEMGLMFYGQADNGYAEFFNALNYLYNSSGKRILITSLGISHYSTKNHDYKTTAAADAIEKIYSTIAESYPRVSGVVYMDKDLSIASPTGVICNNYRVTCEKELLDSYAKSILLCSQKKAYYKSIFNGKILDGKCYVSKEIFIQYYSSLPDMAEESFSCKGYILVDSLEGFMATVKNGNIYLRKK